MYGNVQHVGRTVAPAWIAAPILRKERDRQSGQALRFWYRRSVEDAAQRAAEVHAKQCPQMHDLRCARIELQEVRLVSVFELGLRNGAAAGKVSGAGGGASSCS
jgi:hypothetical protein